VSIVPLYARANDGPWLLHLVRPISDPPHDDALATTPEAAGSGKGHGEESENDSRFAGLTRRERVILRLLSAGR
jgi:hypothetical protein